MEKLMWYRTPTQDYMEGLPLGNGRLAAMALGTPERFRLALNHEWLWRGENRLRDFDDVHEHLSKVRELLLAGRFAEGTRLANDYFGGGGGMPGGGEMPGGMDFGGGEMPDMSSFGGRGGGGGGFPGGM